MTVGLVGITTLFGERTEVVVDHRHVVEGLGHLAVEIERLAVKIECLAVLAIGGEHQRHVVEDERLVIGVVLKLESLFVVFKRFGVFAVGLGTHAVAVVGKSLLGAAVGGQHLEDQVSHDREALVDEVVVALRAGHGTGTELPPILPPSVRAMTGRCASRQST